MAEQNWKRKEYETWDEAFRGLAPTVRQQSVRVAAYTQVLFLQACTDGYGRDIALYLIKSDVTNEKLDCEISEDGHTLSAKLNELGDYAICKLGDGENTSKTEDDITLEKPENNNTAVYIIITVCAVVLIGGVVSFVVIKKKRK